MVDGFRCRLRHAGVVVEEQFHEGNALSGQRTLFPRHHTFRPWAWAERHLQDAGELWD